MDAHDTIHHNIFLDGIAGAFNQPGKFLAFIRCRHTSGDIVLTSSPPDPQGHLSRGRTLILKKKFSEVIAELNKSRELDPDNEQIYLDLAQAYVGLKKNP